LHRLSTGHTHLALNIGPPPSRLPLVCASCATSPSTTHALPNPHAGLLSWRWLSRRGTDARRQSDVRCPPSPTQFFVILPQGQYVGDRVLNDKNRRPNRMTYEYLQVLSVCVPRYGSGSVYSSTSCTSPVRARRKDHLHHPLPLPPLLRGCFLIFLFAALHLLTGSHSAD